MADDKDEKDQAPLDPEQLDEVSGGAFDAFIKLDIDNKEP